ncbi:MAG: hypothetical protein U1F71_02690 [Verrucomicrobiaceae bacterium]
MSFTDDPRLSAELPCRAAPLTNKGLCYVSTVGGQVVKTGLDVTDDSLNYVGKVADRQARVYTNIGFNAVGRTDDIVFREATRYTDYVMDVYDSSADAVARPLRRYPGIATSMYRRGAKSTKKVVQSGMYTYGDAVDAGIWSTLDIIKPVDPKPYMVGSLNDLSPGYAMPGSGWHCRLPELPAPPAQETLGKNPKNPVTVSK